MSTLGQIAILLPVIIGAKNKVHDAFSVIPIVKRAVLGGKFVREILLLPSLGTMIGVYMRTSMCSLCNNRFSLYPHVRKMIIIDTAL